MALAHDLDHLERHIDWFGSVVAKVPDVWGQARLTQYREEFEQQMAAQLGQFEVKLAGSTSRTDQSYFAYSMAISAAASGAPPQAPLAVDAIQNTSGKVAEVAAGGGDGGGDKKGDGNGNGGGNGNGNGGGNGGGDKKGPPDLPKPVKLVASETKTRVVGQFLGGPGTIGLEPSAELLQRRRYLDFLNQLRRENEGSDTADGPGYSLNLVRIPVTPHQHHLR